MENRELNISRRFDFSCYNRLGNFQKFMGITKMRSQFEVMLNKEAHTFSAAHFITFNGNICESLHGHNYRVVCNVFGELDENGYVIDFIALRDRLSEIVQTLDHRVLLPTKHPLIEVKQEENEIVVRFEQKRWVFPLEDCRLLPIPNTTAEWLAWYIGQLLLNTRQELIPENIQALKVQVDENHGQWGCWHGSLVNSKPETPD
jgi:6-pyruvoyltetrahydropterin/6-carboxytetrahydropterin synthase